jgi:hypothetical protein
MRGLRASLRPEREVELVRSMISEIQVSLESTLVPDSPLVRLATMFERLIRSGQEIKRNLEERERRLGAEEAGREEVVRSED